MTTPRTREARARDASAAARASARTRGTQLIDDLLAAAKQQFEAHGWAATSVGDIIAAAGVSRATFYRYFADKRDIFYLLAQRYVGAAVPPLDELFSSDLHDTPTLTDALTEYISRYHENAAIARIWAEEAPHDTVLTALARESALRARRQFRQAFGDESGQATDAFFLLLFAVTERFPYHAFAAEAAIADLAPCEVAEATADILAGLSRAQAALNPASAN